MLDKLLTLALVGTAHSGDAATPLPGVLEEAAKNITDPSAEQRLLTHATLMHAYLRAGCKPTMGVPPAGGAENDLQTGCSARAADLLMNLIRENSKELIAEWLTAAARRAQRVPHRLLADLLELARKDKSLRQAAARVIDKRGKWLISQNMDWQFTSADEALNEELWELGSPEQRLMLLRQLRQRDPARARDLLQKTWKDDPADQRAEFVKLFIDGLSPTDETLLESMLDDRSKQVRIAAADLLVRLPQSQLLQRMIARASPLLTFKRGLLRGITLDVLLPADLDKSAQRDGIEKIAPQGTGEKQWWLQQLLSYVPPSVWVEASGFRVAAIIATVAKTDFADVILEGFIKAAERHPDPIWIDLLLRHRLEKTGRLNRVLLAALSSQQFLGLAIDVLRNKQVGLAACSDLINNQNVPFDLSTARLWVQTVAHLATIASREEWSIPLHLTQQCATRVPPAVRSDIETRWLSESPPWNQYRSSVEKLLKVLEIRQQIEKEFS